MRLTSVLLIIAACACNLGCSSFWQNSLRNLIEFQVETEDGLRVFLRNNQLAEAAWRQFFADHMEQEYSIDFARGFRAGFADFLEHGGNGEPPPVPPFRYRLSPYQNPDGYQAILEWYAGFRQGAAAARLSGYRDTIVLPLASPPINAVSRDAYRSLETGVRRAPGTDGSGNDSEKNQDTLPPPKPLPKDAGRQARGLVIWEEEAH
jgi:hypothetical protein